MYKKLLISLATLLAIIFSFTFCLANNGLQGVADGVRNVVGDAENAVEGVARDISNASKNATGNMENTANNIGNNIKDSFDGNTAKDTNNDSRTMTGTTTNYDATRTSANGEATFMGMNATAWTWLILGIAAIAIIALVWYYSMQFNSSNYDHKD